MDKKNLPTSASLEQTGAEQFDLVTLMKLADEYANDSAAAYVENLYGSRESVTRYLIAQANKSRTELHNALAAPNAQPAPQPAREPLTDAAIMDAYCKAPDIRQYVTAFKAGARFAEQHHGITAKP